LSKNDGIEPPRSLTQLENAANIAGFFSIDTKEQKLARKVLNLQIVVVLIVAGITYVMRGSPQYAIAVLSGGGISIVNGALLAWRMSQAVRISALNAHHQLRLMYFYAAERFLVVVVLLGMCLALLKLTPLVFLGGFVLGQAVLLAARLFLVRNTD
jgi:ATP synthase protein I